jgi:peptidoglycan/LPS O-acetylase OafA/YrhL
MPKEKNNNWIKGLDSIRFILALIVLLSHIENPWANYFSLLPSKLGKITGVLIPNLFSGIGAVIAFFIISGFVIHYPNKKGIPDIKKFLVRRWLRIGIPLFVIAIIALYYKSFDLIPVWSLYCELIYYTIYPLLSKIKTSWDIKLIIAFILSFIVIFILCRADISSFTHQKNNGYSGAYWQLGYSLTWIVGLPCWLLGVLLAETIDIIPRSISVKKIFLLRILVFAISVALSIAKFHFFVSYIFSMNLFALIVYNWVKAEILYYKNRDPVNLLEKMGAFSYSLYLLHFICIRMLIYFFPLNEFSYFIFILIPVFIAYLFYLTVEKPAHIAAKKIAGTIHTNPV